MSWLREPDAEPIPGYRLICPLGTGGFGEVWKCVAPGGRADGVPLLKAIKFVYGNLNSDEGDSVRAEQEFKAIERMKEVRYPFVLNIERIDVVGGELAIVMELADKSLHDVFVEWTAKGLPGIPRNDLLRYLLDAADGLDHLNDKHSLQHLDVKPRNLFLIADRVKVADFGLVKHIERQSSAGLMGGVTPIYAPPETFNGKLSRQSDQYSLAIVYMELLTGARPFKGKNIRQLAIQHMTETPDLKELPEADRPAVYRALAKDPAKRFPTCQAFIRALAPNIGQTVTEVDLDGEADLGQLPPTPSQLSLQLDSDARPASRGDVALGDGPATAIMPDASKPKKLDPLALEAELLKGEPAKPRRPMPPPPAMVPSVASMPAFSLPEMDLGAMPIQPVPGGVLRPTLMIGVGQFGRRVLMELRCRFLDRFGNLPSYPSYRFLYLDCDHESVDRATYGTHEIAMNTHEVFPLPLQPVSNYRRRMLDHLADWLPREKLHAIPRSLQPQGSRALARLAFLDNYLRFQSRLRRELQTALHSGSLQDSITATGLELGDFCPRVFVVGSAYGASSGILADLGYAVRKSLTQLQFPHAPVHAVLYCGTPLDPAAPRLEQANLYATLTELNHFQDPAVTFSAQYGPDGPRVVDDGGPFSAIYLTQQPDRTAEGLRDCVAQTASYIAHDVVTALGTELERIRNLPPPPEASPFRSFGTFSVWYPRGLLLRVAARRAVARLAEWWGAAATAEMLPPVDPACRQAWNDPDLQWERLTAQINRAAELPPEGFPFEATERFLRAMEVQGQSISTSDELSRWATPLLDRIYEWAGPGTGRELESVWKKSKFYKGFQRAAQQLAEQWEGRITRVAMQVLRQPGHRLAAAEAALSKLARICERATAAQWQSVERHYDAMAPVRSELEALHAQASGGGGFKLFGGGAQKLGRQLLDSATRFVRQRIGQDILETGVLFYKSLGALIEDRLKDIAFARAQLKTLRETLGRSTLEEDQAVGAPFEFDTPGVGIGIPAPQRLKMADPFWEAVKDSTPVQIVLPGGVTDMEQSADQFVQSLLPDHWLRLDEILQDHVLAPQGDLLKAATGDSDLVKVLGRPLVEAAANYLGTILPITDVAQVEFSTAQARNVAVGQQIASYHVKAEPVIDAPGGTKKQSFVLIPESEAGEAAGQEAKKLMPNVKVVRMSGQTEMNICRELGCLAFEAIDEMLSACDRSYQEMAPVPATSPHARFDILEWIPLEQ